MQEGGWRVLEGGGEEGRRCGGNGESRAKGREGRRRERSCTASVISSTMKGLH